MLLPTQLLGFLCMCGNYRRKGEKGLTAFKSMMKSLFNYEDEKARLPT